jgi:peptidyl serine alpha-galactosyltransferase
VSGCKDKAEEDNARAVFASQIVPMAPSRLKIHFTPDYSHILPGGVRYPYFNKPYGMRHWMEHELRFPDPAANTDNPNRDESIVVLCDPDQVILRPFDPQNNFTNTYWPHVKPPAEPRTAVSHGHPVGQMYGFDLQWLDHVDVSKIVPANESTPLSTIRRPDARKAYVVSTLYRSYPRAQIDLIQIPLPFPPV